MSWVRIDDRAPENRKLLAAGAVASWLWVCGLAYANRQTLHDGFVPAAALAMLYPIANVKRHAERLVEVGLWERAPSGFRIHDYAQYQPDFSAQREDLAAKRSVAGRVGGLRSGETRRTRVRSDEANSEANSKQLLQANHTKQRSPDPDPDPKERERAQLEPSAEPTKPQEPMRDLPEAERIVAIAADRAHVSPPTTGGNALERLVHDAKGAANAQPWTTWQALLAKRLDAHFRRSDRFLKANGYPLALCLSQVPQPTVQRPPPPKPPTDPGEWQEPQPPSAEALRFLPALAGDYQRQIDNRDQLKTDHEARRTRYEAEVASYQKAMQAWQAPIGRLA